MLVEPDQLIAQLKKAGTRQRAQTEKRSLKSAAEFFGVTVPETRRLARPVGTHFSLAHDLEGALSYGRRLWAAAAHEPRVAAIAVVGACAADYDDRVWELGRCWLGEIDNRALCDGIGTRLLGPFVCTARPRYRSRRREVIRWAGDPNPWIRRGALLSALDSTKTDIACDFLSAVARRLLDDPDDGVQKGLGWMLCECAQHRPHEVITFLQRHRADMRRSTLTKAVSRLPKTLQKAAREGKPPGQ